ncbi:MAG TPA: AsmA family protein, partial [Dongiaceae bacterium]
MRIKTILIAVLVVLVVLLGGATIYVMSIDYNQYKGLIASEVERATGRKLTIDGKVALALSLTPTLTVKDLSLANIPGGSRPQMILLKRLEVQMQLLSLLSHQVKIDLIVLRGADILLETDKTGHGNWVFSHAGSAGSTAASGEGPPLPEISLVKIR